VIGSGGRQDLGIQGLLSVAWGSPCAIVYHLCFPSGSRIYLYNQHTNAQPRRFAKYKSKPDYNTSTAPRACSTRLRFALLTHLTKHSPLASLQTKTNVSAVNIPLV
jgi:hypothetical protein